MGPEWKETNPARKEENGEWGLSGKKQIRPGRKKKANGA